MANANLGEFFRDLQQVVDDIRTNRAPPSPANTPDLWDMLTKLNTLLPSIEAEYAAHQGELTAAADTLAALSRMGVPHAVEIEDIVLGLPSLLPLVEKWVPFILGFRPDPAPLPGMGPRVGRG